MHAPGPRGGWGGGGGEANCPVGARRDKGEKSVPGCIHVKSYILERVNWNIERIQLELEVQEESYAEKSSGIVRPTGL